MWELSWHDLKDLTNLKITQPVNKKKFKDKIKKKTIIKKIFQFNYLLNLNLKLNYIKIFMM